MTEEEESDPETENLEVCIELAIEEEREACAKVADEHEAGFKATLKSSLVHTVLDSEVVEAHAVEAHNIASDIRSRK